MKKKTSPILRVIFGVLISVGVFALGGILITIGMAENKTWMTVLGAIIVLAELVIALGIVRHRRKEKEVLY